MDFDLYDDLLVGDKEAEPTEREKLLTEENESLKVILIVFIGLSLSLIEK
jgi:hypothetical protein